MLGRGGDAGGNFPVPEAVVQLPPADFIAGGKAHVCAEAAGGVYCWGSNAMEQLGFEPVDAFHSARATRVLWPHEQPR